MVWCSVTSQLAAGIVIIFGRSGRVKPGQAAFDFPLQLVLFRFHTNIDATKCIFAACLHISLPIYALTCILAGTHTATFSLPLPPPFSLSTGFGAANNILTFNSTFVFGRSQPPPDVACQIFLFLLLLLQQTNGEGGNHVSDNLFWHRWLRRVFMGFLSVCANFSRRTVNLNGKTWCSL